jgi:hypothetical protein
MVLELDAAGRRIRLSVKAIGDASEAGALIKWLESQAGRFNLSIRTLSEASIKREEFYKEYAYNMELQGNYTISVDSSMIRKHDRSRVRDGSREVAPIGSTSIGRPHDGDLRLRPAGGSMMGTRNRLDPRSATVIVRRDLPAWRRAKAGEERPCPPRSGATKPRGRRPRQGDPRGDRASNHLSAVEALEKSGARRTSRGRSFSYDPVTPRPSCRLRMSCRPRCRVRSATARGSSAGSSRM